MKDAHIRSARVSRLALPLLALLYVCVSVAGIGWGLPSRSFDAYLFGSDQPWSGEKINRLAGDAGRHEVSLGADVDVNPIDKSSGVPIHLTSTEQAVAEIYRRYRLFTCQPDEMITMMSLSGMSPRELDLDPKLYQYGGLFIYPVGALIGFCGTIGLVDVRSDVVYYLDNPDEFGKFYIVARGYAAGWGLLGLIVVWAIGRRLAGWWAGIVSCLLFVLMPVVVCMSHEGKPHLPGAVLMLAAALLAMRHLDARKVTIEDPDDKCAVRRPDVVSRRCRCDWWLMCVCCGASLGMVLSSLPVFVLIPLVAWLAWRRHGKVVNDKSSCGGSAPYESAELRHVSTASAPIKRAVAGLVVASAVYLITNPYIVINAISNRETLASNFGNSLAMYEIDRVVEGFMRVLELTIEGATLPVLIFGVVALVVALAQGKTSAVPLIVVAGVFFLQFVLIGAGKPGEYGRFGIFTNTALAIGTGCLLIQIIEGKYKVIGVVATCLVVGWVGVAAERYLWNFRADASAINTRTRLATVIQKVYEADGSKTQCPLGVLAEPAPYCCPPMNFARLDVVFYEDPEQFSGAFHNCNALLLFAADEAFTDSIPGSMGSGDRSTSEEASTSPETPISWANKPFNVVLSGGASN